MQPSPCCLQEERLFGAINDWNTKSEMKAKNTSINKRFEELKARREQDLDARRARLASKLMREDAALKLELVSMQESPEERRAKLAARARELAGKREAERQDLADSLYRQAFTENCDVLRTTQSKRILYRTLEERTAQVRDACWEMHACMWCKETRRQAVPRVHVLAD